MGFASGSSYAQDTWKIVRDSIPSWKREKLAREIYAYWRNLDADSFNPCSELCQDTKLDEFKLNNPNLSNYRRVLVAQKLIRKGISVHFELFNQEGEIMVLVISRKLRLVKIFYSDGVKYNWLTVTFDEVMDGKLRLYVD